MDEIKDYGFYNRNLNALECLEYVVDDLICYVIFLFINFLAGIGRDMNGYRNLIN